MNAFRDFSNKLREINPWIIIIPVFLFGLILALRDYDHIRQEYEAKLMLKAKTAGSYVETYIKTMESIMVTLSKTEDIISMDKSRAEEAMKRVLPQFRDFSGLGVISLDGNFIAQSRGKHPVLKINVSDRQWFKDTLASDGFVIPDVVIGRASGLPIIPVSIAVKDPQNRTIGVLNGNIGLEQINKKVEELDLERYGAVYVFDSKGQYIVHPNKDSLSKESTWKNISFVQAASRGESGTMEFTDPVDGVRKLAAYTTIAGTKWAVVAVYPVARIYQAAFNSFIWHVLYFAAIPVLLWVLLSEPKVKPTINKM